MTKAQVRPEFLQLVKEDIQSRKDSIKRLSELVKDERNSLVRKQRLYLSLQRRYAEK